MYLVEIGVQVTGPTQSILWAKYLKKKKKENRAAMTVELTLPSKIAR